MAELRPPVEPTLAEKSDYQPLSPIALAAFIISGLFAVIVIILAATAVWSGKPVVVPALLFLAVVGIGLSIAARVQIDRSEGTRAGRRLAASAWWMSILGGAVYAAYLAAMVVAIRSQSLDTAEKWFTALRSGDTTGSFMITLEPGRRTGINPRNLADIEGRFGEMEWPGYRVSEMVRLIQRNGEAATLTPVGVRDWSHEPNGFNVIRTFLLKCPEGEFDMTLALFGNEGRDLNRRIWNLKFAGDNSITKRKLSPYGRAVVDMQYQITGTAREFLTLISQRAPELAYAMTLDPEARKQAFEERRRNDLFKIVGTLSESALLNTTPVAMSYLIAPAYKPAGFDSFPPANFFRLPGGATPNEEQRESFLSIWKNRRLLPSGSSSPNSMEMTPLIEVKDDVIRGSVAIEIPYQSQNQFSRGRIILEARNPELIRIVKELKAQALANPNEVALNGPSPLEKIKGDWQIIGIESDLSLQTFQRPNPGPPGAGGP